MEQVVLNLLNNAKDAIDGAGTITIGTRLDGDWVRIDVADTGGGIAPDVVDKIFFPFFTTKEVGKGTGLGLSISYGIVESWGGRIKVTSKTGAGTTFSVFLPVDKTVGGSVETQ